MQVSGELEKEKEKLILLQEMKELEIEELKCEVDSKDDIIAVAKGMYHAD